jgi:hypothetical protein
LFENLVDTAGKTAEVINMHMHTHTCTKAFRGIRRKVRKTRRIQKPGILTVSCFCTSSLVRRCTEMSSPRSHTGFCAAAEILMCEIVVFSEGGWQDTWLERGNHYEDG